METTTLPVSSSDSDRTVGTALSHGVGHLGRPLRLARTERDPDAGVGQPDRDPAPSRTGPTEDSHVHAPTFA